MVTLSRHVNTPDNYNLDLPGRGTLQDKLYVGFVKIADDVMKMGRLKVWIPELSGDPNDENGWFIVNYCAPFAGATNVYDNRNESTFSGTQKSYGMWFVPPDINNEVICAFINGDPGRGIWLGCLYQQFMNHMVPGIPGQDTTASTPVAEYNKKVVSTNLSAPTRPVYEPLAEGLLRQGLNADIIRGVSDSGARRDEPANSVYGILTPGGSQFVFDDSPANRYIRLRTTNGAQIMINDTTGFIYMNSVDGRNWISMDATGKIDVYAQDDISIRSQGSVNIRGDLDVNIEAGRDINMRARGRQLGAGVSPNPVSDPPPSTPPVGNIVVIGDSIAVGTGQRIDGAVVSAEVGASSQAIYDSIKDNPDLRNSVNAIFSVGSNDGNMTTLTQNLERIRSSISATNNIWLLPYDDTRKQTVKTFAEGKSDKVLDLSRFPTSDNIHPRDYALVANEVKAMCVPSPSSSISPSGAGQVGQAGGGAYNVGFYRTLPEAEEGAARYRSAADYVRANPNLYTPDEQRAAFRLEAASNAEVQRLRGEQQTTPTSVQAAQPGPQGPVAPGAAAQAVPTGPTGTASSVDWRTIAGPFIKQEEGIRGQPSLRAYPDPPNRTDQFSIGFGHLIKNDIAAGRTSINCGNAGSVPILGPNGRDTVMNAEQAEGAFQVDLENLGAAVVRRAIRGAWDVIGPYQKAALVSYAYNVGNLGQLMSKGLTNYINSNEIESAAQTIQTSALGWRGNPTGLTNRRKKEADLYREKPELAGAAAGEQTVDGYPRTADDARATASGAPVSTSNPAIQGGFIKIQAKNSMHLLTDQHMFVSSGRDMHRLSGNNMFDTALQNMDRAAGGYVHESVRGDYSVGSGRFINLNGPRIDLNGSAPPAAVAAAQAIGPVNLRQTDAVVNSLGNVVAIMTDTIMPHLPYHEPYDNHGGRHFENIRDATRVNQNTGLRDGEIVPNSSSPLDIYGTPRSDMPPAVYRGVGYNTREQPLYQYETSLANIAILNSNTLVISEDGKQFIKSRENGSYRPITVGNPPKQEIGYGHGLTPEEVSQGRITINGEGVTLQQPLTQEQINQLFDEDIDRVQSWMKPEIKAGLSQTQYDMFCSLAFNIGENNFRSSNALKNFNEGDLQKVPNTWMEHTVNGAGQVVQGLVQRRRAEVVKFMQGPATDVIGGVSNTAIDTSQF